LKKVCYKVSLCEYCQRQSCTSFTDLPNRAKWIVVDDPFYLKFCPKPTHPFNNADFQSIFARVSAVTPTIKVQLTRMGSSLWAFQWA